MNEPTPELRAVLRRLKLSPILATLPERATLARQRKLAHTEFLELVLSDEVARRDRSAAANRARAARLDPEMVLETWDEEARVRYDKGLWTELCSLRFVEDAHNVFILGPVGVGKSHLASALGHIACRRARSVLMVRADKLVKTLKASRLDQSYEAELRKLIRVDVLIVDDFCLQAMDAQQTQDVYEVVVERHRSASTIITSNRTPDEWLQTMSDPLLAQSAVDRLQSAAYELVIEGDSYRRRQRPTAAGKEAKTTNKRHGVSNRAL
jgi:DNA replication protein DnaC